MPTTLIATFLTTYTSQKPQVHVYRFSTIDTIEEELTKEQKAALTARHQRRNALRTESVRKQKEEAEKKVKEEEEKEKEKVRKEQERRDKAAAKKEEQRKARYGGHLYGGYNYDY